MKNLKKIDTKIENFLENMIDLQAKLVAIPAIDPDSGGEGENVKATELKRILENMELGPVEEYRAPDKRVPCGYRPNLVIRREGSDPDRTIWIMSHLDVVPAGDLEKWSSDPFVLRREGDLIFGRGVEDNHQGLVASVFAYRAIVEAGTPLKNNIGCIFVADEETGSKFGIQYLLREHPELFEKNDLILVPDSGNPEGTMIEIAEKSILWLKIITRGKQCHASRPYKGRNAFAAASELAAKIHDMYKVFPQMDPLFDPPYSTFEPTKKEANVPNINTIPGHDVFCVDCRVMPGIPLEEISGWIRIQADEICRKNEVGIDFEFVQKEQAAQPTPEDSPIVDYLKKAIREVYKVDAKAMGIGGGTVAAYFRRHNLHAAVWSRLDECAHQPNEFCRLSNLIGDSKVFARVLLS